MDELQAKSTAGESPVLASRREILRASALGSLAMGLNMSCLADDQAPKKGEGEKAAHDADPKEIIKKIRDLSAMVNDLADKWMSGDPTVPARKVICAHLYPEDPSQQRDKIKKILDNLETDRKTCTCHVEGTDITGYDPCQCVNDGGYCVHAAKGKEHEHRPWEGVKKAIARLATGNALAFRWMKGKGEAQEVILYVRRPLTWKKKNLSARTQCTCKFDDTHVFLGLTRQQCFFLGGDCQDHEE
jgi:hypothetical protein